MPMESGRQDAGTAVIAAAERLFSERGFSSVSLREIARAAGVNVGSVTYHFRDKTGLLEAIYERHARPINARRLELLGEARRIADRDQRLVAILRAYVLPAFSSSEDLAGGGARFTRMRAMLSAEGDANTRRIIAEAFDAMTRSFIDAIAECLPRAPRTAIVWRSHFLLGSLYYTLVNPERIDRLSDGAARGCDTDTAIAMIVESTCASLRALDADTSADHAAETASPGGKT